MGKAEETKAGLKALMMVIPSQQDHVVFSLQIQEKEPNSKKPELFTLVWREVIDYFLLLVKSYSN